MAASSWALVVLMGCLIAAVAAYHHIYMKTPDYAVAQVIRAAHSGDIETFSQHIDEEALSGQFFDALVSHTSDSTDEAFFIEPRPLAFAVFFRHHSRPVPGLDFDGQYGQR